MAGMLIRGGATGLVGSGLGSQPPLTQSPPAATSGATASEIAYGPQSTMVAKPGGRHTWLTPGPHSIALFGVIGLVGLVWVYRQLPR